MQPPKSIKHIHMIAICGTGMGSLAGLLKGKGYTVTGSDQNTYPPMSTQLENLGIKLFSGYRAENLLGEPEGRKTSDERRATSDKFPDLVIVGNAVSKNNPEVQEMLRLKIPYLSMPDALSKFFISGRQSICVAGTHGKTTTCAIISHLLLELGADPSFLIGGVFQDSKNPIEPSGSFASLRMTAKERQLNNYRIGNGCHFVIEGDEYDTAFFDKGPKFLHYQPYYTILTSIEFDHADIYRDIDHLTESFEKLISIVNPSGLILACSHYERLIALLGKSKTKVEFYRTYPKGGPWARTNRTYKKHWEVQNIFHSQSGTTFDIYHNGKKQTTLTSPLPGKHNVLNALAAFALLRNLGYPSRKINEALQTFKGIKRRQEVRGIVNEIIIIDDFAHHPTSVAETIDAVKNRYPDYKLWAVFEPRSNTSIRNVFQKEYAEAFSGADHAVITDPFKPEKVKDGKVLDIDSLAENARKKGVDAHHIGKVDDIVDHLVKNVSPKSVILIMSNGGFGGIHGKLLNALK